MNRVLHLITGLEKGGGAEAMLLKTLPYLKNTENAVCVLKGEKLNFNCISLDEDVVDLIAD